MLSVRAALLHVPARLQPINTCNTLMTTPACRASSWSDRLLDGSIRLLIVSLISAAAGAALFLGYQGALSLFVAHYAAAVAYVSPAALLGAGAVLLFQFRDDLMQ